MASQRRMSRLTCGHKQRGIGFQPVFGRQPDGRQARSLSHGFTLVELLVVITIIGMLMALLLPAVNAATEAARNVSCKNKLSQISLAALSYEQNNKMLPGYLQWHGKNAAGTAYAKTVTWPVMLFAHFDAPLADAWSGPATPVGTYVDLLVCNSNPPERVGGAMLGYVCNAGGWEMTTGVAGAVEVPAMGVFHNRATGNATTGNLGPANSIDTIESGDGSSRTVLFSENLQTADWNQTAAAAAKYGTGFVFYRTGVPSVSQQYLINKYPAPPTGVTVKKTRYGVSPVVNQLYARPSSWHPGGVNVAFADRSVSFLRESVDYRVYIQLMTPNQKEAGTLISTAVGGYPAGGVGYILQDADYK